MSKTVTVPAGTMAAPITNAAPQVEQQAQAPEHIEQMPLSELLNVNDSLVRIRVIDAFLYNLHFSLLYHCQREVFYGASRPELDPTAAKENARNLQRTAEKHANFLAEISGGRTKQSSYEIARTLGRIRAYALERGAAVHETYTGPDMEAAYNWLLSQMPQEATSGPHVAAMAELRKVDQSVILKELGEQVQSDLARATQARPLVLALAQELTQGSYNDEIECENAFDSLPALMQVNFSTRACNAVTKAYQNFYDRVSRGRVDMIGPATVARALHAQVCEYRLAVMRKHSAAIFENDMAGNDLTELQPLDRQPRRY